RRAAVPPKATGPAETTKSARPTKAAATEDTEVAHLGCLLRLGQRNALDRLLAGLAQDNGINLRVRLDVLQHAGELLHVVRNRLAGQLEQDVMLLQSGLGRCRILDYVLDDQALSLGEVELIDQRAAGPIEADAEARLL